MRFHLLHPRDQLVNIMNQRFEKEIKIVDLFRLNTIKQISRHLSLAAGDDEQEIEAFSL